MQSTCLKHCTNLDVHLKLSIPEELCLKRCVSKYTEVLRMVQDDEQQSEKNKIEEIRQPEQIKKSSFFSKLRL